jgi:hypothetical protein
MTKRQLVVVGLAIAIMGLSVGGGSALAQTKITKPSGGLPIKITKSGSYFLGGNLAVTTKTTTAIIVKVDNVTINLNGFIISGLGTGSSGVGIDASIANGVTITNGTVTGYGTGIALSNTSNVQNMLIYGNASDGVSCTSSCLVANSIITGNGSKNGSGLDFADSTSGYQNDVLNNSSNVLGGTNMGNNVCSGTVCP